MLSEPKYDHRKFLFFILLLARDSAFTKVALSYIEFSLRNVIESYDILITHVFLKT